MASDTLVSFPCFISHPVVHGSIRAQFQALSIVSELSPFHTFPDASLGEPSQKAAPRSPGVIQRPAKAV